MAKRKQPEPQEFLPLTHLAFHVLLALGSGPAHGYALVKEVRRRSDGAVDPGTGSFYSVIRRLEEDGLLEEVDDPESADARRRCYAMTTLGRAVLSAEARRMEGLLAETRRLRLFLPSESR